MTVISPRGTAMSTDQQFPAPSAGNGPRPFVKMHGLRNHFAIFDRRDDRRPFTTAEIVRICDCETGVGAEQLVTIERAARPGADVAMRLFNIDGREVGACGNATRCVAWLVMEETGRDALTIETAAGLLDCRRTGPQEVSVRLGPVSLDWRAVGAAHAVDTLHLPLTSGPLRDGIALWIGNPHVVFFVEHLDPEALVRHGPAIQNDPLFPEGVNVGMASMTDARTIRLAVWERPGMLTKACGTGACVAAFAARRRGLSDAHRFTVHLPGGALDITLEGEMATMAGPVATCCRGTVAPDDAPDAGAARRTPGRAGG